jgi:hypothetical protein
LCSPLGPSIANVYPEAPVTFDQEKSGVKSPIVGLPGVIVGVGSLRWKVRVADQVSPIRFSSSARTRQ